MRPLTRACTHINPGQRQCAQRAPADGSHVGNLKRIGAVWKFKAIGYDAAGKVIPGGGPLTDRHNSAFAAPDALEVSAKLGLTRLG